MPSARRQVDIDASPDILMDVIRDFTSYPTFLPEMEQARILSSEESAWEVFFCVRVIRRLEYTLRLVQEGPLDLRWSLVEGAFTRNDGSWKLEPLDGGKRTRATYSIELQVGMFVPGNIVRSLVQRTLPATLDLFKQEAERRAGGVDS